MTTKKIEPLPVTSLSIHTREGAVKNIGGVDINTIAPIESFQALPFWDKLTTRQQNIVAEEGQQALAAMYLHGASRLAIGGHFYRLGEVLKPLGYFDKFISKATRWDKRTIYRYIADYLSMVSRFPETIVKELVARNLDISSNIPGRPFGRYTEAVEILGPPSRTIEPKTYVDQLEQVHKERNKLDVKVNGKVQPKIIPRDPDMLLETVIRVFRSRFQYISPNRKGREKTAFVEALVGMIMTEAGMSNPHTFHPTAVPEEFKTMRGRPRKAEDEDEHDHKPHEQHATAVM